MLAARSALGETTETETSSSSCPPSLDGRHRPGDIVGGRYVLIEPLGRGGMGVVWKARSSALGVDVAVKLVKRSQTGEEPMQRMAREAHAAAQLAHPAMVTVLDFGTTHSGDPYVAMELLRGESVADVLCREHHLDAQRAVATLLPIVDGLGSAHDKGIVHRDVKPENLFVSKDAQGRIQPKLLDFGIAKLEQKGEPRQRLTLDGTVLGSPGYFSPEQARGQSDIDSRTDIWSICVVLYELVTGDLPFNGPNYNALLMAILKDEPVSITAKGFGDEALWKIIERGLSKDRKQRWSSMWELGQALAFWLYQRGVRTDVSSRSLKEAWLHSEITGVRMHVVSNAPTGPFQNRRSAHTTAVTVAGDAAPSVTPSSLVRQRRASFGLLLLGTCAGLWALATRAPASSMEAASAREPMAVIEPADDPPPVTPPAPTPPATPAPAATAAPAAAPSSPPVLADAPERPRETRPSSAASTRSKPPAETPAPAPTATASAPPKRSAARPAAPRTRRASARASTSRAESRVQKKAEPRRIDREFGF